MAAILKINIELFLVNWKANWFKLSGNQMSDTGPSWPSCLKVSQLKKEILIFFSFLLRIMFSVPILYETCLSKTISMSNAIYDFVEKLTLTDYSAKQNCSRQHSILFFYYYYFWEKTRLVIPCESSAMSSLIFSEERTIKMSSVAVVISALRVKCLGNPIALVLFVFVLRF